MAKNTITKIFTAAEVDRLNRSYFMRDYFDEAWYYDDDAHDENGRPIYDKRTVDPRPKIFKNLHYIEEDVKKARLSNEVYIPYRCVSCARDKKWNNFDIIPLKNDLYKVTYPTECASYFFPGSAAWNLI